MAQILIMSREPSNEIDLSKICGLNAGFVVFATPIYFSSQINEGKIKSMWDAFGTSHFPRETVKTYIIEKFYASDDSYLDSVFSNIKFALNNHIRKTNLEELEYVGEPRKSLAALETQWRPTETEEELGAVLKYQMQYQNSVLKGMKKDIQEVNMKRRYFIGFILIITTTFALQFLFGMDIFGLVKEIPKQKSWWKLF